MCLLLFQIQQPGWKRIKSVRFISFLHGFMFNFLTLTCVCLGAHYLNKENPLSSGAYVIYLYRLFLSPLTMTLASSISSKIPFLEFPPGPKSEGHTHIWQYRSQIQPELSTRSTSSWELAEHQPSRVQVIAWVVPLGRLAETREKALGIYFFLQNQKIYCQIYMRAGREIFKS